MSETSAWADTDELFDRKSLVVSAHAIQPDIACLPAASLLLPCCAFTSDWEGPMLTLHTEGHCSTLPLLSKSAKIQEVAFARLCPRFIRVWRLWQLQH